MKKGLLIVCAISGVVFCFFAFNKNTKPIEQAVAETTLATPAVVTPVAEKPVVVDERVAKSASTSSQASLSELDFQMPPEYVKVITEWSEARGYDADRRFTLNYEAMDAETLNTLADQNDPKAHLVLANRALASTPGRQLTDEQFDYIEKHLYSASMLGYSSTLNELSELMRQRAINNFKTRQQWELEAYRFAYVSELRGDVNARTYLEMLKRSSPISDEDNQFILVEAENTYNDLAAQRNNLGLPDFDNTTPPEIEAMKQRAEEIGKEITKKLTESLTNKQTDF